MNYMIFAALVSPVIFLIVLWETEYLRRSIRLRLKKYAWQYIRLPIVKCYIMTRIKIRAHITRRRISRLL